MLTETLLHILFSVIGRCSPVLTAYWLQGKCAGISLSHVVSGMIKQNNRRCAADFSLLNLPKGKSLGRSKPATNS